MVKWDPVCEEPTPHPAPADAGLGWLERFPDSCGRCWGCYSGVWTPGRALYVAPVTGVLTRLAHPPTEAESSVRFLTERFPLVAE